MAATGPVTSLHYTANGNFDSNGNYLPGADGFNLADISSADMLNYLPAGVKGLVYLGMTDGVTAAFTAVVNAAVTHSNLYGFYIVDEPAMSPTIAANLKAEADYINAIAPGAVTFMVEQNFGSQYNPSYYYTPANTDIKLFGLDPYPVQTNVNNNYDPSIITTQVAAAESAGIPQADIVPVYQAFGGGGYSTFILPTPQQEQQILATWASVVPTPQFDFAYSWGVQQNDTALSTDPQLAAVFAQHNGVGGAAPPAPTFSAPANGATDTTTLTPTISGGGVTGDTVSLAINGTTVNAALPVDGSGNWSYTPTTPLTNGSYTLSATQTAPGGLSSSAATESFTVSVAPPPPAFTSPASGSTDTATAEPTISGTGVAGDLVTLSIGSTVVSPSIAVLSDGTWSYTPTTSLTNGSYTLSATQTAPGGPSSPADTETFTVNVGADPDAGPETPTLAIVNTSLNVNAGSSVALGITATPTDGDDVISVVITGLPSYESIIAPAGDNVSHQLQSNGTYTWTVTETASNAGKTLTGLSLHSSYQGRRHPVASLGVTASNLTSGEAGSSAVQTIRVTDPPATSTPSATSFDTMATTQDWLAVLMAPSSAYDESSYARPPLDAASQDILLASLASPHASQT